MLLLIVLLIVIIIIIIGLQGQPSAKGPGGEALVKSFLLDLPPIKYKVFHNIILPTPDGSTQIDHVVISVYGVFVIETKNMKGWIFGDKYQKQWTQVIYGEKYLFQNPLRQNYKHTRSMANFLKIPHGHVFSVIAFVGSSTFKTPMPPNVTDGYGCVRYIGQYHNEVFSQEDVQSMVDRMHQKQPFATDETARQHIEHVKNIAINKPVCTLCGKPMVQRVSKKGGGVEQTFLGCSGWPECRHTAKLPSKAYTQPRSKKHPKPYFRRRRRSRSSTMKTLKKINRLLK